MNTLSQFISRPKTINSCGDSRTPSLSIEVKECRKSLSELKQRNIRIRFIPDITKDNLAYCKDLINYYAEIRYFRGN
jgi:DNA-dependent RNA polymerase auxiliary subunit epsilon